MLRGLQRGAGNLIRRGAVGGGAPASIPTPWYLEGGIAAGDSLAAWLAIGAADKASSYENLKNPGTYDLVEVNGVLTWSTVNGWGKGGDNNYLNTGITLGSAYTVIVRAATSEGVMSTYLFADNDHGAEGFGVIPAVAPMDNFVFFHPDVYTDASGVGDHVFAITGSTGYVDGDSAGAVSAPPDGRTLRLFTNNIEGEYMKILAAAAYSATLTEAQIDAVTAAMAAL